MNDNATSMKKFETKNYAVHLVPFLAKIRCKKKEAICFSSESGSIMNANLLYIYAHKWNWIHLK